MGIETTFAGSVPALYDQYLAPLRFQPYADDLAERLKRIGPARLLETAAGTGVATAAFAAALPECTIVATDLNQPMLDVAARKLSSPRIQFRQADAQNLPFEDEMFDAVVCQFGVMFFPDRIAAYREARRVLRSGAVFLLNAWDRLERNPVSDAAARTVAALFPDSPPDFYERVPFGYHDARLIEADLRAAGFVDVEVTTVEKRGHSRSAREAAIGLCQGTPLRNMIELHGPNALDQATDAVAYALSRFEGPTGLECPMSAHVAVARKG